MTRSILMHERLYRDPEGRPCRMQYFLLVDEVVFGDNTLDIYGAEILSYRSEDFLGKKTLRGITPFGPRITALINCMADSLTPPERMERMVKDRVKQLK